MTYYIEMPSKTETPYNFVCIIAYLLIKVGISKELQGSLFHLVWMMS